MATPSPDLPHDFPDRAIREALTNADNLRELLLKVIPDLVPHMDFSQLRQVPRTFLLDDYRERESDFLVEIPFRTPAEAVPLLLCILLEHQSSVDDVMPLRLLLYAVLYWEQQWKTWKKDPERVRGQPLRLTPVLPVVLHTGAQPWDGNRTLAELFEGEELFRAYVPQWQTWMCDLATMNPSELVQGQEAFWQALAVVRSEREDTANFLGVFGEAVRRLEMLASQSEVRWGQLLKMILHWAVYRRPITDWQKALGLARSSQKDARLQQEIEKMSEQAELTYGQEVSRATRLSVSREHLLTWLEERFQTIPDSLRQKIASADLDALERAIRQSAHIKALDELQL